MEIIRLDRSKTGDGTTVEGDHHYNQTLQNIFACVENFEVIALRLLVISIFVFFHSSQYYLVLQYCSYVDVCSTIFFLLSCFDVSAYLSISTWEGVVVTYSTY